MNILKERLEDAKKYDPATQIIIIWDIEDIKSVRPDLIDEQANEVLQNMKNKHDANVGINWDVIECVADMLFPKL